MAYIHINFDLDRVLVDFDSGAFPILGKHFYDLTSEEKQEFWAKAPKDFFLHLPLMPYANELIDIAHNSGLSYGVLTALPHSIYKEKRNKEQEIAEYRHNAMIMKLLYCQRNFGHTLPVRFGPMASEKKYHCFGSKSLLIDDSERNIFDWVKKGGVGIHHDPKDATTTMKKLREFIDHVRWANG